MTKFGKRIKKRLKKVWKSRLITCLMCTSSVQDDDQIVVSDNSKTPNRLDVTPDLQLLIVKALQSQVEDRECRLHLRSTLLSLTKVLEDLCKNCSQTGYSEVFYPPDKFSNFTITVSKSSPIQCQADYINKSLMVRTSNSLPVQLPIFLNRIFLNGGTFGCNNDNFSKTSFDKAIQSNYYLTTSKLIQTRILGYQTFDIRTFKFLFLKHIRSLREDVLTLRELLFLCENNQYYSHVQSNFLKEEEEDQVFFQAKTRASNFAQFYKMRKISKQSDGRNKKTRRNLKNKK